MVLSRSEHNVDVMKIARLTTLSLLALHLTFAKESATTAAAPNAPRFVLAPTVQDNRAFILLTDTARYSFTSPRGWLIRAAEETREVSLVSPDGSRIDMRFNEEGAPGRAPKGAAEWRAQLQKRYPHAEVIDEPEISALSKKVVALDLDWTQGGISLRSGRFARIPLERGSLEISLVSARETFGANLPMFMQLMLSFRTGPAGEPVAVRANRPE